MAARVERLVNLTITLLEARRPMSLQDLRVRTGYYDQADRESARRMFERDKDELRSSGVPIRTVYDPLSGEAGYLVDRTEYELPDVDLTRDEAASLAVALRITGQADEHLALSKLAARAPGPLGNVPTVAARVSLETEALDEVADAVVRRAPIRFSYRTGAGQDAERTVDPWGVVLRRGAWYVVGRDHDRDASRAFRLDRVTGPVTVAGEPDSFQVPDGIDLAAQVEGPASETLDVLVAVTPAARWAAESRGGLVEGALDDGRTLVRLQGADAWRLVPWLLGLGAEVEVLEPASIRSEIRERLAALVGEG